VNIRWPISSRKAKVPRPVAVLGVAAIILSACSSRDEKRDAAIDAVLRQLSAHYRADDLCLHHSLVVRQPAREISGIYIETPVPAGFEIVDVRASKRDRPLEHEEVKHPLPAGWRVGDGSRELCFELTIPVIDGERAVVSARPVMPVPSGRTNYWLRRAKGRWSIAAISKGDWDI
jgi:hypothetical protein